MHLRPEVLGVAESPLVKIGTVAAGIPNSLQLQYGEPDSPTPAFICRAATEAMSAGHTFYTDPAGYEEVRAAVAAKVHELHGVTFKPSEVLMTVGAGMGITLAIRMRVGPGDNAVIVHPSYSIFPANVTLYGGEPRAVPLSRTGDRFHLDIDRVKRAIDARTKMLIVNSPSNPTGWIISREEQQALLDLAIEHDLLILSDEVYDRIVFDRPIAESFARLPGSREHVLVVNSFSKTYSMTGWRLGYALGSEGLIQAMTKVAEFMTSSAPAMLQQAGITALRDGESFVRETQARYAARRKLVIDGLATMPRLSLAAPEGAFFAFPRVEGLTDSTAFALDLLRATGVAVAPGAGFGNGGEGHIRLCFASSERVLAPALVRLGEFLHRSPT